MAATASAGPRDDGTQIRQPSDAESRALWSFGPRGPTRAEKESASEQRVRARAILEEFGLLQLRNERAGNLSGGQKRLLEFARIRMAEPRLVILDEPMGGVNPVLGERMATAVLGFRGLPDGTRGGESFPLPHLERRARQAGVAARARNAGGDR